ncbi:MAG: hypothetical protein WCJ49_04240 [Deltaproteobacteria bacterium]
MFERKKDKIALRTVFIRRIILSLILAGALILMVLSVGIAGYHWIANLNFVDALLEASMILGGMGPVSLLTTNMAKIFASLYALFSGIVFIGALGIVFSPIVHRMLHNFHLDEEDIE